MMSKNTNPEVQNYINEMRNLREKYKDDFFSLEKREEMKEICIRYIKNYPETHGHILCVGRGTPRHRLLTIYAEELEESNQELKKRGLI